MNSSTAVISDKGLSLCPESNAHRRVFRLEKGWKFRKGDPEKGKWKSAGYDDLEWETVTVPP